MKKEEKEAIKEISIVIIRLISAAVLVLISYFVYKLIVGDVDLRSIPIAEYTLSDIGRIFLVGMIVAGDFFLINLLLKE